VSVASRSISHSATRSVRSQTPAAATLDKTETLINKLDFDRSLIPDDSAAVIRLYYIHYKAVLVATLKYEGMHKSKAWDASFIPTTIDIIKIVTSRTMSYSHYKMFEKVSHYPELMEWLDETEEAPGDVELWGFECEVYQWGHLQAFIKRDGEPLEDSDGEKVPAKKKKSHKKAGTRTKGKSRARAASPSGGESGSDEEAEPVHKSSKKKVASGSCRR
jgi:hypothetical protein